ncbi:uncharacterized protein LOC121747688 isoform X1 [Salvia splendens]|uniref:uncharacterized protein LOC121747688 isoform X1 n=1 Tax=Salvia splendens TaxID=180675 RepID=UPI001C2650AC|nr:uncharacterized protein LOC121747688 isoform X1 [Salvia splendens]XP_041997722.1 uncharacterized protein LOC121747688 isoform X1 [Salvia splendens]XP_041997724.1 uncharacterized protein LOC121747688 isoform X1 [Salvia splendens]
MEEMKLFDSKELQKVFDSKDEGSKQVKRGKVLHIPSLDELGAREQFLSYLHALGFEWLLENGNPNISVRLAKEFFTTFRFRVTTDLDEVSISFRLFEWEISMNLIELTVRLGMCSLEEAIGSEWRNRERGIPRRHVGFEPQEAWEELTHPASGEFASTLSCSIHSNNPIQRLVQFHLDFNLLGQSNSAVRTSMTELYLLWYAKRGRKLHLGFWTAYQCHLIATHPARNLTLCHILGVFVRNNIIITEAEGLSPQIMVDPPGLFDTPFFVRTNAVYMRQGVPHFYAMGEEAIPTGRTTASQGTQDQEQRQERLEKAVEELASGRKVSTRSRTKWSWRPG